MSEFSSCSTCCRIDTCALTGAAAFALGMQKTKVLINGPLWCYFYAMRYLEQSRPDLDEHIYNSQPDNYAIVYGTEKYIQEALMKIKAQQDDTDLLFLENSCALSLIGDDIGGIAKKIFPSLPVVVMDSGGVRGGFSEGYIMACLKILESLEFAKQNICNNKINLIGATPFYFNGKADLDEIKRLLKLCEYNINVVLGYDCNLETIKKLPDAALNIVLNIELGLPVAEYLQKRCATPFLCAGIPYGVNGTKHWLNQIKNILPCDDSKFLEEAEKTSRFILAKNNEMNSIWGRLWFDNVLVSAPDTIAVNMAHALRSEWLDTNQLIVITKNEIDSKYYNSECIDKLLIYSKDNKAIEKELSSFRKGIVLASSSEGTIAVNNKNVYNCNISYPVKDEMMLVDIPFCGLNGSKYMMQRLWNIYIHSKKCENI